MTVHVLGLLATLFLLLETVQVFIIQRVSILALEGQQVNWRREQVKVSDKIRPVKLTHLCELLQCVVHVFWDFGPQVDVRLAHDFGERVSESDLFDGNLEVHVESVFKSNLRVIQHFEFFVVRALALVCYIELVHAAAVTAEAFDHEDAHFAVHELEAPKVVQHTVCPLLL